MALPAGALLQTGQRKPSQKTGAASSVVYMIAGKVNFLPVNTTYAGLLMGGVRTPPFSLRARGADSRLLVELADLPLDQLQVF